MATAITLGLLLLASARGASAPLAPPSGHSTGFGSIAASELARDLEFLASPELEGRDSPSLGLARAAEHIAARFQAAGLLFAPDSAQVWKDLAGRALPNAPATGAPDATAVGGTYLRPWTRQLPEPDASKCRLVLAPGDSVRTFALGVDFVPVAGHEGTARGELVFAGFGIQEKSERYDDLAGLKLDGKVALIVAGEPEHPRAFDGPEVTRAAALWRKLDALASAGAAAVLVVRRPIETDADAQTKPAAPALGFRHTWATWQGEAPDAAPRQDRPIAELSPACASALLGEDVLALAAKMDKSARPVHVKPAGGPRVVDLALHTQQRSLAIDNVVGWVRGTDLSDEYVVLGAHYDHIGVDERGRIGCGADDNASGTAALLEIAEALALAAPRRSAYVCAFSGEEDGLLGSRAFCQRLPVAADKIVAMVNLDMIGRGTANEVAVLGIVQNPGFEKLLQRARGLEASGVQKIVMREGEELFARSDHYSFHQLGIPTLFFFEGLPLSRNKDYHTWRDTLAGLDQDKVLRTTRFVYSTLWLISNDDERPARPRD